MNSIWLLYDDPDYAVNQSYAALMHERGAERGLDIETVLLSQLELRMDEEGVPYCLRNGKREKPHAVLSRQRSSLVSQHFERMGVPVFNNSLVCEICNDKRITYQFLSGLPMPETVFLSPSQASPPAGTRFPVVLKPACSHGGDRILLVHNEAEWKAAAAKILPQPALQQNVVSDAGKDLRVYVLHGRILAGVMRQARSGIVSNFKQGGLVTFHRLTDEEQALAEEVIRRFSQAGAPLHMAGVDLLYDHGRPVIGEVEDVVGSRMLYQTSDIDLVGLYLDGIALQLQNRNDI